MIIDDDAKVFIYWDATLTFDPTTSTVELDISGTRYAMTWQGSPVVVGNKWLQTAKTTQLFRGSSANNTNSPVALTPGTYLGEPIVTIGSQIVPCSSMIEIVIK